MPDGALFGEGPMATFLTSLPTDLSCYETALQAEHHLRRVAELNDDVIIGVLGFRAPARRAVAATHLTQALRLPPESTSAGLARDFTAAVCESLGLGEIATYDACLVVTEVVTNAVLHARTEIELRVTGDPTGVRIEVEDRTPVPPELTRPRVAGDLALLIRVGREVDVCALS